MVNVGTVHIRVRPNVVGFRQDIKRQLQKQGLKGRYKLVPDTKAIPKAINEATNKADKTVELTPEIDFSKVTKEIKKLRKSMETSLGKLDFKGLDGIQKEIADKIKIDPIKVKVDFDVDKLKIPDKMNLSLDADSSAALAKFSSLEGSIKQLSGSVASLESHFAKLNEQQKEAATQADNTSKALERQAKATTSSFEAGYRARRKGLRSIDELGTRKFAGLSRVGWIAAAAATLIAPAIQSVSGALAALPALGTAAGAALGVTALGWDGIKKSAEAAAPALERAQEAVSAKFLEGMTPQFEALGSALDRAQPNLLRVADGLIQFSDGVTKAVSQGEGFENLAKTLDRSGELFQNLAPFSQTFTEGLIQMAEAGSRTFPQLAEGLNEFGSSWKKNIEEMAANGTLEQSILGAYEVLGSIGTSLGGVMRSAMEEFTPDVAANYASGIEGIGAALEGLMSPLTALGSNAFNVIGEIGNSLGQLGTAIDPTVSGALNGIGPALSSIADAAGNIGSGVLDPIAEFLQVPIALTGPALQGVADGLAEIGNAGSTIDQVTQDLNAFEGAVKGIEAAAPTISQAFKEITEPLFELSSLGGVANSLQSLEMEAVFKEAGTSLDDFMGKWDRLRTLGLQSHNIELVIETSLRRTNGEGDLQADIDAFVGKLETMEKTFKVNLTPQIEMAQSATTDSELWKLGNQVADAFMAGTLEPQEVPVPVAPNPEVDTSAMTEGVAAAGEQAKAELAGTMTGLGSEMANQLNTEVSTALGTVDMSGAATTIATSIGNALGGVTIPTEGLSASISSSISTLEAEIATQISGLGTTVQTNFQNAFSGVTVSLGSIQGEVAGAMSGITASISAETSAIPPLFQTAADQARSTFVGGIQATQGEAAAAAGGIKGAVQSALTMDFTSSGAAAGNSFAAGLRSTTGAVASAAAAVAAAAKAYMPHSPAKKGPLSGKGYTDESGKALALDFARGMRAHISEVAAASSDVAGAAQQAFSYVAAETPAFFETHHRSKIYQKAMQVNAKKIASWHKRQQEAEKKSAEKIAEIQNDAKRKQKSRDEAITKERERLAKSRGESWDKLVESLESPDYSKIKRSFNDYWLEGSKEILRAGTVDFAREQNLSGQLKEVTRSALAELRSYVGDNPLFAEIETNINAEHFEESVYKAIEESGLGELPITVALENFEQLKKDLNMGDGVISRALEQAMAFEPTDTDARRHEEAKTEIHYHVTDLQEAMRLEEARRQKELMKG